LAREIAGQVDVDRAGLVLELGPGTGAVTQALLARGVREEQLVAIEQEASFTALMRTHFSSVAVHRGDALSFERFIPKGSMVAAIVSGLPLLQFPMAARLSLLKRALACQSKGGRFIQLSYSWRPPVIPIPGTKVHKRIVWRNLPPAHIWTYERSS
jgi:phosphatidylethanolamine/phosphatidyl-N-methylethanolamine N-methyltransferase